MQALPNWLSVQRSGGESLCAAGGFEGRELLLTVFLFHVQVEECVQLVVDPLFPPPSGTSSDKVRWWGALYTVGAKDDSRKNG